MKVSNFMELQTDVIDLISDKLFIANLNQTRKPVDNTIGKLRTKGRIVNKGSSIICDFSIVDTLLNNLSKDSSSNPPT